MANLGVPVNGVAIREFYEGKRAWTLYRLMYPAGKYKGPLMYFKLQINPPAPKRVVGMQRAYWLSAGPKGIRPNSYAKALAEQRPALAHTVTTWLAAKLAVNSGD
jgi:hypothetical protein